MSQKRDKHHIRAQKETKIIDDYTCIVCGRQFKNSHGHHLIYYSEGGGATVQNMTTLCPECHRAYHQGKLKVDIIRS